MKPPPLLLGAALLFWGWQTGFLLIGAGLAVALESPRLIRVRWEFSDDDFFRIWIFSALLFVGALVYAFTANQGPADFAGLLRHPNLSTQHNAAVAGARTVSAWIRWLPMVFFLLAAGQAFSSRESIPVAALSLILRH